MLLIVWSFALEKTPGEVGTSNKRPLVHHEIDRLIT
jgi:hypothetical protein